MPHCLPHRLSRRAKATFEQWTNKEGGSETAPSASGTPGTGLRPSLGLHIAPGGC